MTPVGPKQPPRLTVQYDAHGQLGEPFDEWLDFRFSFLDQPGSQIDAIIWDIGWGSWAAYPSTVLPRFEHPGLKLWWEQGLDWVGELVAATHARGRQCLWNHRVSEVDLNPLPDLGRDTELMMDHLNPVKAAHPDWVIKTWWWQGLWNYAVPEVRDYQLSILREVAQNYDLDGFQIDFARHLPVLPVGRQWELREGVTEFMRRLRGMLDAVGGQRGRRFELGARVPNTLIGCRADGMDVWTWAQEGLVDFLTPGTRSMQVEVEAFREIVGPGVRLQPCFDDHHATDGYRFQPIEFLRGVFANWLSQGADGVTTFNWPNASPELSEAVVVKRWGRQFFGEAHVTSHEQAYRECGTLATLRGKDKVFAVERRGGYPWAEGYFNRNDDAPLPVALRHDGTAAELAVRLCDVPQTGTVTLRAVLFGMREGDAVTATLNGAALGVALLDHEWKDGQIFSPAPQPPSGGPGVYALNPGQRLTRVEWRVPLSQAVEGANMATVAVGSRVPYCTGEIILEKLEVHVHHE